MQGSDATPAMPHLTSEFFTWLWFTTERLGGSIDLGGDTGPIDLWIDSRISFRAVDEDKARAVMTGENPSTTLEARAALAGGKVLDDLRLGIRREDREYSLLIRGPHFDLHGVKMPAEVKTGEDEMLYERMYLYDEIWFLMGGLYTKFALERTADTWRDETLPAMRAWVQGTSEADLAVN